MTNIVKIINTILGEQILPETKYYIQKIFSSGSTAILYYRCSSCNEMGFAMEMKRRVPNGECFNCKSNTRDTVVSFVTFPLKSLLFKLLEAHERNLTLHDQPPASFPITDMYNGILYQQAVARNGGPIIAIGTNSDGVKRFNHTKSSLWPLYIVNYNLPPHLRMRQENLIVFGIFNGRQVPVEAMIIPLVHEIDKINEEGGLLVGERQIKVFLLTASLDSTARPKFQNHHQFNGEFGCYYCYDKGETIDGSRKYPLK